MDKINYLLQFDKSVYTITLYEVMVEHSGLGIGQPVNVGFAIDKKGELGLQDGI
jgi:hypothetical protein